MTASVCTGEGRPALPTACLGGSRGRGGGLRGAPWARLPPGGGPTCLLGPLFPRSFLQLGAGLSVGLSGLAAGFAIGIVGDAGVRGTAQQPRLFVGMILILIFAEVLGLYGLIVALILSTK